MRLTLASNDAKPMGGKVFNSITSYVYYDWEIQYNAQPFDDWYRKYAREHYHENGTAYILISPYLSMRKKEAEDLKKYITRGNTVMVVTDGISDDFKNVFDIAIKRLPFSISKHPFGLAQTFKSLADTTQFDSTRFGYFYNPMTSIIDSVKGDEHTEISKNMLGLRDGIEMSIGSGKLIFITNAEAFSNYFLLTKNNFEYANGLLSYLPTAPDELYWDEFYRRNINRGPEDKSIFSAILAIPALRWAFWILIALCAIAIFTHLFRRQRIIPVRIPNKNTTVEFTQTIARLYFNKKDNRNIALKMIQHFMEHIRSKYYIPHQKFDHDFALVLSGKTNQPISKTTQLVERMQYIHDGAAVSDDDLLKLNRDINELLNSNEAASGQL